MGVTAELARNKCYFFIHLFDYLLKFNLPIQYYVITKIKKQITCVKSFYYTHDILRLEHNISLPIVNLINRI
jgi:hypothetical protein